jgi:4-diphosphocytidyl-2-C-methyl-D-erythritol kinase
VKAYAKINLALVVGPTRADGKHEVASVLQRVDLADEVRVMRVEGGKERVNVRMSAAGTGQPLSDELVGNALSAISEAAGVERLWNAAVDKEIPIAAGLGGGSSDAAAALWLANSLLAQPLLPERLHELAAELGADVPFFLTAGPQLGTGDGTTLEPLDLPQDYTAVLLLADGEEKESTAAVYDSFDESGRAAGFEKRRRQLLAALAANDLAAMPPNDLASSPLAAELVALGAFRADVSGAGPTVYGLFHDDAAATRAAAALEARGRVWIATPKW